MDAAGLAADLMSMIGIVALAVVVDLTLTWVQECPARTDERAAGQAPARAG